MLVYAWIILVDMATSFFTIFSNLKENSKKLSIALIVGNFLTLAATIIHVITENCLFYIGIPALLGQLFLAIVYIEELKKANPKESLQWKIKIIAQAPVIIYCILVIVFAFI